MPDEIQSTLKEQIAQSMRAKETEELLQIWQENDRRQWSEISFEIVREILQERLGVVPPQALPPEQMVNSDGVADEGRRKGFLWGWLFITFIGWFLVMSSFMFQDSAFSDAMKGEGVLILSRVSFPLGVVLGILQCFDLERWKISKIGWIVATAAGWGIPAYLFLRLRYFLLFYDPIHSNVFTTYLENQWIIFPAMMCLIGALIGAFQAFVMGKRMTRPGLWVLANALGLFALGFFINGLLKLLTSANLGPVGLILSPQFWVIMVISLIMAALLTGLPAGMVIEKYEK